jgi:hypothetical protein
LARGCNALVPPNLIAQNSFSPVWSHFREFLEQLSGKCVRAMFRVNKITSVGGQGVDCAVF